MQKIFWLLARIYNHTWYFVSKLYYIDDNYFILLILRTPWIFWLRFLMVGWLLSVHAALLYILCYEFLRQRTSNLTGPSTQSAYTSADLSLLYSFQLYSFYKNVWIKMVLQPHRFPFIPFTQQPDTWHKRDSNLQVINLYVHKILIHIACIGVAPLQVEGSNSNAYEMDQYLAKVNLQMLTKTMLI